MVADLWRGRLPLDVKGRGEERAPVRRHRDATTYVTQPRTLGPQPPTQVDPWPFAEGERRPLPELENTETVYEEGEQAVGLDRAVLGGPGDGADHLQHVRVVRVGDDHA